MKNLFLFFVCTLLLLVMKQVPTKEQLERRDVSYSEVVDFNGKLFLPKTLQLDEEQVKAKVVVLNVTSKKYKYKRKHGNVFYLTGEAEEVPVFKGDLIKFNGTVKLFFAREV